MSAQHIPGPWHLSKVNNGLSVEGGLAIDHQGDDGQPQEVCAVWGHDDGTQIDDETRANARLIAAAPDLLALAHQYALECSECSGSGKRLTLSASGHLAGEIDCEDCADIRAVIDKAEGRS